MFKLRFILWICVVGLGVMAQPVMAQKKTSTTSNRQSFLLQGQVSDQATGQLLQGASLYFPDQKKGVITNEKGQFQITLPAGNYLVEVSYIGYTLVTKNIDLHAATNINFALNHSALESTNVTVTSFLRATSSRKTSTPITIIKRDDLLKNGGTNLIDALSNTPGVAQITTGPAISKPIIRGLGYNRVMVLNDGVKQEGQQWGDEHGIEIDEYNVSRIEVLKVPASIIYGSEALSGVINIVSNVPVAEGATKGNIFTNYQSNNQLLGSHFDLAGNHKGIVWGVNGSSKQASDYQNKYDGYVYNSKFKELDGSAFIGLEKEWGYTHFYVSRFSQQLGMVEGERNAMGGFIKANGDVATSSDFAATTPAIPYQHIFHTKYTLDNSIKWGEGRLKANIAYQRNERMEFGNVDVPSERSLYFDLGTLNYSFQYLLPEKNNWKHTIGVNGMQQQNINRGVEFLIPEYKSTELGLFFFTQKRMHAFTLSGGARIDNKGVNFNQNIGNQINNFKKDFGDLAGSFGVTYEPNKDWVFKFNIARGYRAPNMSELGSNGAHEGTNRYEYGNTQLRSEKSMQIDLGAEWSSEHISFTGNLFYNHVDGYIYYQKLINSLGNDSLIVNDGKTFYAFAYQQQNANLYGAECNIDFHPHPLDGLHIENTLSYVRGNFTNAVDGSKDLPAIPPFRWLTEIKYEFGALLAGHKNNYISVQLDNVSAQDHPFTGYHTETATPGYTLLHLGMGTHIHHRGKDLCSISLLAQNLTDVAYQNHLSRLKYTDMNDATGRMGVYNMGRNYSLKLNFPLNFN